MVQDIFLKSGQSLTLSRIRCFLWNPKIYYRVYKNSPLGPMLSQPNPVRPIDPYLPKVHLNVILPLMPRSSQWSLPFGSPNRTPVNTSPLPHVCHMSHPPHSPWCNHPNNIRWRIQDVKSIIIQFCPWSVFLPFRSKYISPYSLLRNPQSMFLRLSERPSFASIQHNW
jgi:hypothetical protein